MEPEDNVIKRIGRLVHKLQLYKWWLAAERQSSCTGGKVDFAAEVDFI